MRLPESCQGSDLVAPSVTFCFIPCSGLSLQFPQLKPGTFHRHCEINYTNLRCSLNKPEDVPFKLPLVTRRQFTTIAFSVLLSMVDMALPTRSESRAESPAGPRTVFDEERLRHEEMEQALKEKRNAGLRASFDGVEKAKAQVDDVADFVKDGDWSSIRNFTHLFNDAVVREGMEKTARRLDDRKVKGQALDICKHVTDELRKIDQGARRKDGSTIAAHVQRTRELFSDFQQFRP